MRSSGPLIVLVGLMSLGFLAGGVLVLRAQHDGERTTATVSSCVHRRVARSTIDYCTGTWVQGGSLLTDGRVVRGTIDGANSGDVGKRIDVRVSGGRAYTTSKRLPIILFTIGALFALAGGYTVLKDSRRPQDAST